MKISLLISAIIFGVAALFFVPRQNEINSLTTAWNELESRAHSLDVPTDPEIPFFSTRTRTQVTSAALAEKITLFLDGFVDSYQKLNELREGGDHKAFQVEHASMYVRFAKLGLSPDGLRLLVEMISADATISYETGSGLIRSAILMFADENPKAALAITIEKLFAKGKDAWVLKSITRKYLNKDPSAAAQWLESHHNLIGEIDEGDKGTWIRSAAGKDLAAAISLITTLKPKNDHNVYHSLSNGVTSENANAFLAAIREKSINPEQRALALNGLNNSKLMRNFETGTAWLDNTDFTDEERKAVLSNVSDYAFSNQTGKWLDWIANQEKDGGFIPPYATQSVLEQWTLRDFGATGNWINSLEDGPRKDFSIQIYSQTLAPFEPGAAAEWAVTLPEGEKRSRLLQTILPSFHKKDPEAAASFAGKHGLSNSPQ
jgi:hypothetical protein